MVVINLLDENDRLRYRCGTTGSDLCANRWPGGMDGISIYRKDLDPYLADLATGAGAELRTSTLVTDVVMENGVVSGVKTDTGETFMAEVVIAADGAMSTMARKSGMRNRWGGGCTLVPQLDFSADEEKMDLIIGNAEWCWFGPLYGDLPGQLPRRLPHRGGPVAAAGLGQPARWTPSRTVMSDQAFHGHVQAGGRQASRVPVAHAALAEGAGEELHRRHDAGGRRRRLPLPAGRGRGLARLHVRAHRGGDGGLGHLKGDDSERALAEYERRWKASDLGKEHEFGPEFVDLWNSSIFDPKLMTEQIQMLLEYSMLHPFSIVFDWGDAHMDCFNQHIDHMLDLAPEFGEFGKTYIEPLARGICRAEHQAHHAAGEAAHPAGAQASRTSSTSSWWPSCPGTAALAGAGHQQDAAISREAFEGRRKK